MKIYDFKKMKEENKKITMVTCYDYWSAIIVANSDVDCVLVGDSLAMVMHGHQTTLPATIDLMASHVAAVAKGIKNKFIIGDMPFCSYRKSLEITMNAVEMLMQAGAHAIKLEGVAGNELAIRHIVESGVPVMGHIGLTPQSVHQLGGFRLQGRDEAAAKMLIAEAKTLEDSGCFAVVLECVPNDLAANITASLSIPTIGIGAGNQTSGQVLVLHDLLGLNRDFKPKFVKHYIDGFDMIKTALNNFNSEVKNRQFPSDQNAY